MTAPEGLRATLGLSRLNLQQQAFLILLVAMLIASALALVVGHQRTHAGVMDEAHLRGRALAGVSVTFAAEYLAVGEHERLDKALRRVMLASTVERIEVEDRARGGVITLAWQALAAGPVSGQRVVVSGFGSQGLLIAEHGSSELPLPVVFEGRPFFWMTRTLSSSPGAPLIGVLFAYDDILDRENQELREQLLTALGFTALTTLVLFVVISRALRPVAQLAAHMRELRLEGGEAWKGRASSHEVGEIAAAYEALRLRLRQQVQAMRAGNELLAATLDTAPSGLLVVDDRGRVRLVNRAARRQFLIAGGQDQGESGPRIEWLLPELDRMPLGRQELGVFEDGQGWRCQAQSLNGNRFLAQVHKATLRVDGRSDEVYSVRDISRDDEAQRQVQLRTQRLNSVLTLSTEGIVLFSAQRHVAYVNPQMLQYLSGTGAGYLINLPMAMFERLLAERSTGARPYMGVDENQSPEPLVFALDGPAERVLSRTWRHTGGDDNELVMFFRDVTEQEVVARMKSEFLSAAAHELRTPLTSILGFSDLMLQHELPPEEQRELLQTMRDQSALLVNIINEMLDLSRIESRQGTDFNPVACLVRDVCRLAVASVRPPGDLRQVDIRHEDESLQVWADPEKLHQVLVNLLSNAFKFSPGGGPITLSTRLAHRDGGGAALIEVRDHGMGMNEAELSHLFERFFRADKSGHIPGTGLGLALVKEIMDRSGGRVQVRSTPGRGTVVELTLPAAPQA